MKNFKSYCCLCWGKERTFVPISLSSAQADLSGRSLGSLALCFKSDVCFAFISLFLVSKYFKKSESLATERFFCIKNNNNNRLGPICSLIAPLLNSSTLTRYRFCPPPPPPPNSSCPGLEGANEVPPSNGRPVSACPWSGPPRGPSSALPHWPSRRQSGRPLAGRGERRRGRRGVKASLGPRQLLKLSQTRARGLFCAWRLSGKAPPRSAPGWPDGAGPWARPRALPRTHHPVRGALQSEPSGLLLFCERAASGLAALRLSSEKAGNCAEAGLAHSPS